MKTPDIIIDWFDKYDPQKEGVEPLQKARQRLSVYLVGMADQMKRCEKVYQITYHQRRIAEAEGFLSETGTRDERINKAMATELRQQEAQQEGELKGLKIMYESYCKVLDAMASQIRMFDI